MQSLLSQSSFVSLGVFNYNHSNARYQLVKFILISQLLFLIVENESLEAFVNEAFTPLFKKIHRNTVTNDVIKMFRKERVNLKTIR